MAEHSHEELLAKGIEALKESGLRVIRLDRRTIPDAIAVDFQSKKIMAVETETSASSIWLTRRSYERHPKQFDEEIVITKPFDRTHFKSRKAYELCLELKAKNYSERQIQREVKERLNEHVSSGQIHNWIAGRSKPISLRD